MPQLLFLIVAAFLLTNKVYSPQYVLWLVFLFPLARPRWRDYLVWTIFETLYFVAVWWYLEGLQRPDLLIPTGRTRSPPCSDGRADQSAASSSATSATRHATPYASTGRTTPLAVSSRTADLTRTSWSRIPLSPLDPDWDVAAEVAPAEGPARAGPRRTSWS